MDPAERDMLKFDYDHTMKYFHELAGIRFKLLAIVPVFTGVGFSILSGGAIQLEAKLGVSLLGMLAVIGLLFYDQRNNEIYNAMQIRAKCLEILLRLPPAFHETYQSKIIEQRRKKEKVDSKKSLWNSGGPLLDRPSRTLRYLWLFDMWHDRGLNIIYSSSIGLWSYLFSSSCVDALGLIWYMNLNTARLCETLVPLLVSIAFTVLTFLSVQKNDWPTDGLGALPDRYNKFLYPNNAK
jgi:hypothetical protein